MPVDTRERIKAARERLLDLQSDEHEAKLVGRPCGECRHRGFKAMNREFVLVCGHLAYTERRFDPSSNKMVEDNLTPRSEARSPEGLCGPEAILFEPASTVSVALHRALASVPGKIAAAAAAGGVLLKLFG